MATDDPSLISEVRTLTDYNSSILTDGDMQNIVSLAKREIEGELGEEVSDFYSSILTERALFWLTCLFSKIKVGELEGLTLAVAEIEVTQIPDEDRANYWARQFERRMRQAQADSMSQLRNIERSDRVYGDN